MKKILCLFLCLVPAIYLGGCSGPGRDNPNLDEIQSSNDVCGDGKVTGSETCDTAATDADKQCVTEEHCKSQVTDSCKRGVVQGDGCTVSCGVEDITACTSDDGCCPTGCTADNDSDCTSGPGPDDPAKINATIGVECTDDSACGQDGKCEVEADDMYKGGYCYAACETTEGAKSCPDGSKCVASKGGETRCMKECTAGTPGSCRDGYECTTDGVCEALVPGAKIGEPCTADAECGLDGKCIVEQSDGLFKGGYCVVPCSKPSDCPTNSHCFFDNFIGTVKVEPICVKDCLGDSSCREGYWCESPHKSCLPQRSTCDPAANDCPIGSDCRDDDGDGFYKCELKPGQFGTECEKDDDCQFMTGAQCLKLDSSNSKGFCTISCKAPNETVCGSLTNGVCKSLEGDADKAFCFEECDPTSFSNCSFDQFECVKDERTDRGGICTFDLVPDATIGIRCTENSQCGQEGFCLKERDGRYKEGICTSRCSSNHKCPTDSSCNTTFPIDGASQWICLPSCLDDGECRDGYTCLDKVCDAPPAQTCTKGASPSGCPTGEVCGDPDLDGTYTCYPETEVGKPCTQASDCTSNICHIYDPSSGEGFCSQDCENEICPEGSRCSTLSSGSSLVNRCVNTCNDTEDCRQQGNTNPPNFSCYQLEEGGACWNTLDVIVGDACTTSADCATKGFGAICTSIHNAKFCTIDCSGGRQCPSGSQCYSLDEKSPSSPKYCVQECSTSGACPTGTTCQPGNICY